MSPRAIRLFLKYFDSIDQALSRRLVRKRTWDEESLTFLLTELLDLDAQSDHKISYPNDSLVRDLSATDEPLSITVQLETHTYPKPMERFVTQSDIGFILSYVDQFDLSTSFRRSWLMQAKRLFHTRHKYELGFTQNSRFESFDADQHERMKALRDWAKCDFIRYLLYCPRPSDLDRNLRERLCSARSRTVAQNIFDYSIGLELRDDFLSETPTVAAGIFVAFLDDFPDSFLAVHSSLFSRVFPFSWFIVSQLAKIRDIRSVMGSGDRPDHNLDNPIVEALIRGDIDVFSRDETLISIIDDPENAQILPAHTVTVSVVNGVDRPRDENLR